MQPRILFATALMAVTSMLAFAQTPKTLTPPTPAQIVSNLVARLTTLLDLTSAQQTSATGYFTTEETTLATVRTGMHTARTALKTAITSGDTGAIATLAGTIGTLTTTEVTAQATADAQLYGILTQEQQTKYASLGGRGGLDLGGPGGPGPRGFGTH
jgi:Spy/CpxP family protein refolding chaperone